MKIKSVKLSCLVLGLSLIATPGWSFDYSSYSTEQLANMRGTLRNASQEERNAFRSEWQKRMLSMSASERQQYMGRPANAPAYGAGYGKGRGRGQGICSGTGTGQGQAQGRGYGGGGGRWR